ncbi:MAG: hypothetical protein JO281_01620 [Pseudonocardiales bacterium]|nr:hypothetical protein [Pseudonocardiales bacterium]
MTTAVAGANDLHVESPEERRAARTIKLFIVLGWLSETTFLFFGMIMFPQLHPSLIGRLIWTQILCGIGMGAATGAIAYLAASGFKQGSRAALIITAIAGATVLAVCNTVCFFVDSRPGVDYWGSHENPALFLTKGYIVSIIGGLVGSWLLNTKRGVSVLDKIPFLR